VKLRATGPKHIMIHSLLQWRLISSLRDLLLPVRPILVYYVMTVLALTIILGIQPQSNPSWSSLRSCYLSPISRMSLNHMTFIIVRLKPCHGDSQLQLRVSSGQELLVSIPHILTWTSCRPHVVLCSQAGSWIWVTYQLTDSINIDMRTEAVLLAPEPYKEWCTLGEWR
jgi:hypothetical protein